MVHCSQSCQFHIFGSEITQKNIFLGELISNTKIDCGSIRQIERFIPGVLEQVVDRVGYTVEFPMLCCSQSCLFHIFGF